MQALLSQLAPINGKVNCTVVRSKARVVFFSRRFVLRYRTNGRRRMEGSHAMHYARMLTSVRSATAALKGAYTEKAVGDGRVLLVHPAENETLVAHVRRDGALTIEWRFTERLPHRTLPEAAEYLAYVSSASAPICGYCNPDRKIAGFRLCFEAGMVVEPETLLRELRVLAKMSRVYGAGLRQVLLGAQSALIAFRTARILVAKDNGEML